MEKTEKTIIVKDEFVEELDKEFRGMMFDRPVCTYEWIYNQAIDDMIKNMRTFMDDDWQKSTKIKLEKKDE